MRRFGPPAIMLAAAAALGAVSFLDTSALVLCLVLPTLMVARAWRWWPVAVAAAFFGAATWPLVGVLEQWGVGSGEHVSLLERFGYPMLLAAVLAAPFALLDPAASALGRVARTALALLLLTLPPIGWVAWLNPLVVAGVLFPGAGLLGLALTLALFALLAGKAWTRDSPRVLRRSLLVVVLLAGSFQLHELQHPGPQHKDGWYAVATSFPPRLDPAQHPDRIGAIEEAVSAYLAEGARVIVLPESIVPGFSAADELMLNPLHVKAQRAGATVLIGITLDTAPGAWRNALYALGKGARGVVAESRIPVPVGNWRLSGGVPFDGWRGGTTTVAGESAHVAICYEEMPLWAYRDVAGASVLVTAANHWMLRGNRAQRYPRTTAEAMARLMRLPLVRAVNN